MEELEKVKTWLAESLEPGFHKTGHFFSQLENMGEYSPEDNRWGTSKLRDKNLCVWWCWQTCLKSWNSISSQKTLSTSQMTSVSKATFQMKSTEYLVVFLLKKSWNYFYLPKITQWYFAKHIKTLNSLKWLTSLFTSLDFMEF